MQFDPLDFLSIPTKHDDQSIQYSEVDISGDGQASNFISQSFDDDTTIATDDDVDAIPLVHVMDLPPVSLFPPYCVLETILKLLAPTQICNFGHEPTSFHSLASVPTASEALEWLNKYWLPLASELRLQAVAEQAHTLRSTLTTEYNAYMTRLVGSPLHWMLEDEATIVHTAACARLAENCGRTAQPGLVRKLVIDGLDDCLYLQEPALTGDNLGLKTWGSSLVLSQRLAVNHKELLLGSVLELGAGTGLVGLVCDKLGFHTTLTDLPEIVGNLEHNVTLNKANSIVKELDWSDASCYADLLSSGNSYTTIIASDPVYSAQHPPWLVQVIDAFLSKQDDARVLVQVPLRPHYEAERQLLWDCFKKSGFKVVQQESQASHDDFGDMSYTFKMLMRDQDVKA